MSSKKNREQRRAEAAAKAAEANGGGTAVAELPEEGEAVNEQAQTQPIELADPVHDADVLKIHLKEVKTNRMNPRESAPQLISLGYGIFQRLEGADKPALMELALNDNEESRTNFCSLVEKFEPKLVDLAKSIRLRGRWLQNGIVRKNKDGNGYDLEIGCRRALATAYNFAKFGDEPWVYVILSDDDDEDALYKAFEENAHRLDLSPMEMARWFNHLKQKEGLSVQEIGEKVNLDHQVVRQRIHLLKLPDDVQAKVHSGEIGVVKALAIAKGKADKAKPGATGKGHKGDNKRRRAPTVSEFQALYDDPDSGLHEEVRKWLAAFILDVEYQTKSEVKKEREKAEKAEKEKAEKDKK